MEVAFGVGPGVAAAVSDVPQLSQNAAPAVNLVPHDGQPATSSEPHALQNLALSLLSRPQDAQSKLRPLERYECDVMVTGQRGLRQLRADWRDLN